MRTWGAVVGAVIAIVATDAFGERSFISAQDLWLSCSAVERSFAGGTCLAYVTAMADVMASNPVNGFRACIPPTLQPAEVRDVVAEWLYRQEDLATFGAAGVVAEALETTYPCN